MTLLIVGAAIAVVGGFALDNSLSRSGLTMQADRLAHVQNAIDVAQAGGPPLLGSRGPYATALKSPATSFYPADATDDPGLYLYLPILSRVTGETDPLVLLRWLFVASFGLVAFLYPYLFYLLFDSKVSGAIAALVVLFGFTFLRNTDVYWVPAWAVLFLMPIVVAVARRRWSRRTSLGALFFVAIAASYATTLRSGAGIGVGVAALIVASRRESGIAWRAGAAALVVIGYLSVNTFLVAGARAYRDHVSHMPAQAAQAASGHPFWHPMYLGLGYLPNPWGIRWDDSYGLAAAQKVDPSVPYLSPRYNQILRHLYVEDVTSDPGYAFRLYLTKAATTLHDAIKHFWFPLLLLPGAMAIGRLRRTVVLAVVLSLPALVIAFIPPVMTIPHGAQAYNTGWLAAVGFLALVVLAWAIRGVEDMGWSSHLGDWYSLVEEQPAAKTLGAIAAALRRRWVVMRTASLAPLAVALVGALVFAGVGYAAVVQERAEAENVFFQRDSTNAVAARTEWPAVANWRFAVNGSSQWRMVANANEQQVPGGLAIQTTPSQSEVILQTRPRSLRPGTYLLEVDGAPTSGGFSVGVFDIGANHFDATGNFWDGEPFTGLRASIEFVVPERTLVNFTLANWRLTNNSSEWLLRSATLRRAPSTATVP